MKRKIIGLLLLYTLHLPNIQASSQSLENLDKQHKSHASEYEIVHQSNADNYFKPTINRYLSSFFPPNSQIRHHFVAGDEKLYSVSYTLGPIGDRLLPQKNKSKRVKHLILAGGSNTFGQWLPDNKTIGHYLAEMLPKYHIYNISGLGYGPNNILTILENSFFYNYIRENEGYFIFNFFDYHINRVACSFNTFSWNSGQMPRYEILKDDLAYTGKCIDSFVNKTIYASIEFIRLFGHFETIPVPYPWLISEKALLLTVNVFKKIKELYKNNYPRGKFIVFLNPLVLNIGDRKIQYLENAFHELGITFVKAAKPSSNKNRYLFKADSHINKAGAKLTADLLYEVISENLTE